MTKLTPISRKRISLEKKLAKIYKEYEVLQDTTCEHKHDLEYKLGGSSGNWDRSDDCYWIDWKCNECGKRWTTDQNDIYNLTTKVYPHAVRIRDYK